MIPEADIITAEWRDDVIERLARIETKVDRTCDDVDELERRVNAQGRDVARLQVKAGLYGTLAGAVSGFLGSFLK